MARRVDVAGHYPGVVEHDGKLRIYCGKQQPPGQGDEFRGLALRVRLRKLTAA